MSFNLKEPTVNLFVALSKCNELLNLLEVPAPQEIKEIREQIKEDRYPNNLIDNNLSRLCIYETPSFITANRNIERCFIEIDIYVTKEKNEADRRALLIAGTLIENLDAEQRRRKHLPPLEVGVNLSYSHRLPNMFTDNEDWVKYGLVFSYENIII